MLLYCVYRIPEISDRSEDIDNAMKWGFGWEIGPFELLNIIGLSQFVDRLNLNDKVVKDKINTILTELDS